MLYFNLPLRAKQGLSFPPSLYRLCLKKFFGFQPTPVIYITCSDDPNFHFYFVLEPPGPDLDLELRLAAPAIAP